MIKFLKSFFGAFKLPPDPTPTKAEAPVSVLKTEVTIQPQAQEPSVPAAKKPRAAAKPKAATAAKPTAAAKPKTKKATPAKKTAKK
jgi:hypothetical protein